MIEQWMMDSEHKDYPIFSDGCAVQHLFAKIFFTAQKNCGISILGLDFFDGYRCFGQATTPRTVASQKCVFTADFFF